MCHIFIYMQHTFDRWLSFAIAALSIFVLHSAIFSAEALCACKIKLIFLYLNPVTIYLQHPDPLFLRCNFIISTKAELTIIWLVGANCSVIEVLRQPASNCGLCWYRKVITKNTCDKFWFLLPTLIATSHTLIYHSLYYFSKSSSNCLMGITLARCRFCFYSSKPGGEIVLDSSCSLTVRSPGRSNVGPENIATDSPVLSFLSFPHLRLYLCISFPFRLWDLLLS